MSLIDSILPKSTAYRRFCIAVRVMEKVLAAAPGPVSTGELERAAGCSAWLLARVCSKLAQADMLLPASGMPGAWLPGPAAGSVTLADILCTEIVSQAGRQKMPLREQRVNLGQRPELDAFVMQATININQIVLAQLRRFPLRRASSRVTLNA